MNREDRCQVPAGSVAIAPPMPPMDILSLAAVAEAAGSRCTVIDYTLGRGTTDDLRRDMARIRPDVLVVSVTTPTLREDLGAFRAAKKTVPDVLTIAKGAHFLKYDAETLREVPDLDIIIRGEPEMTFRELLEGRPLDAVPGITWRSGSGIRRNPERPFLDDLDSLPFPARHLVDMRRYARPDNGRLQGVIRVSRGCPHHCVFCLATPVSGGKVRMRSPENILTEIRQCIDRFGMRDFLFWSDVFNHDRPWVERLCSAIIDADLRISWASNLRADNVDEDLAVLMKRSGCHLASVGVESGSQEVLDRIGKRLTLSQVRSAFAALKKAGIRTFAYYVFGLPWETRRSAEETIRFALELDSDYANFFAATAFPGTRLFERAVREGAVAGAGPDVPGLFDQAYAAPTVAGPHLSREEIIALQQQAVKRFFFRSRYLARTLAGIRGARELVNYCKAAASLLRRAI